MFVDDLVQVLVVSLTKKTSPGCLSIHLESGDSAPTKIKITSEASLSPSEHWPLLHSFMNHLSDFLVDAFIGWKHWVRQAHGIGNTHVATHCLWTSHSHHGLSSSHSHHGLLLLHRLLRQHATHSCCSLRTAHSHHGLSSGSKSLGRLRHSDHPTDPRRRRNADTANSLLLGRR